MHTYPGILLLIFWAAAYMQTHIVRRGFLRLPFDVEKGQAE